MKYIDELENQILPLIFSKITKNCHRQYDIFLKPYGLSKHHAFYLTCLHKFKSGLKMNDFNSIIGCDKANTSRAIADLLDKGLICKSSEYDNEKKYSVKLTDKGYDIADSFVKDSKKYMEAMLDVLSDEESQEFMRMLKKIVSVEIDYDTN